MRSLFDRPIELNSLVGTSLAVIASNLILFTGMSTMSSRLPKMAEAVGLIVELALSLSPPFFVLDPFDASALLRAGARLPFFDYSSFYC